MAEYGRSRQNLSWQLPSSCRPALGARLVFITIICNSQQILGRAPDFARKEPAHLKVVVTTNWNTAGLIGIFLDHYRRLGFETIYVMDFDSTDGSRDILYAKTYQGLVRHVPYPGIANLDSSAIMLDQVRRDLGEDAKCLFCDPDELLVLPEGRKLNDVFDMSADAAIISRFNMTGLRSRALNDQASLSDLRTLPLRIVKRAERCLPRDMETDIMNPPWIYTQIPGKVIVRPAAALAIAPGDHSAEVSGELVHLPSDQIYLMHFPLRSFAEFADKISRAAQDFDANPELDRFYGWQLRRWVRLSGQGRLHEEYLQQFLPDEEFERSIADQVVVLDESLRHVPDLHPKAEA
jgi:hypothetical protein